MKKMILATLTVLIFALRVEAAASSKEELDRRLFKKLKACSQEELDGRLFDAVKACNIKVVDLLLRAGANVDAKTSTDRRPLHYAAEAGCLLVVDFLLQKGADVKGAPGALGGVLHAAVEWPRQPAQVPAIVERLLKAGASVHVKNVEGRTPLHAIALEGSSRLRDEYAIPVAFQFLAAGVDVSAKDMFGNTAAPRARRLGRHELANLIESYPGRTLQERIIFLQAKRHYDVDEAEKSDIERGVIAVAHRGLSDYYVNLFYKLIGKKRP